MMSKGFMRKVRNVLLFSRTSDESYIVVLIESHFRPATFRIAEYILFILLWEISYDRALKMTIGMNQLRVDRWIEYFCHKGKACTLFGILTAGENIHEAASATRWFLRNMEYDACGKHSSLSKIYSGRNNPEYDRMFTFGKKLIKYTAK